MMPGLLWARRVFVALAACYCAYYTHSAQAGTAVLEPASGSTVKGEVTFSQAGSHVRATG